jgi:GntR family transcriptional repressor for pyruvate dehydrogenase complex
MDIVNRENLCYYKISCIIIVSDKCYLNIKGQGGTFLLQKAHKTKLYEEVVQQIQQMIIEGKLKKGDMLPSENELAKQTQVSRITIREALRLLAEMGLIETRKGVGSFVIVNSGEVEVEGQVKSFLGEFENNFEEAIKIKQLLDPEIAKYMAQFASEENIKKLEDILELMVKNKSNNQKYAEACTAFHITIIESIGLPMLTNYYKILEEMEKTTTQIIVLPTKAQREIKEIDIAQHRKILQAIKERNPDLAYFYTKEHLAYFYRYYKEGPNIFVSK